MDISAEAILSTSGDLRGEMTRGLQDERVLKELAKMGVDKKEVEQRLAAMSDQELQQVKQGLSRQAGGDSVTIGVTTLLLIIIIILIIR
ncbi:MAG: PA2779 family protein [Bdellovibrionales bacterium]|nr:PA2779 family protein [Oligoflexia bacterium]